MKEFIVEFLKLFANCILVVCFAFSSFLLIINIYHFEEVGIKYDSDIAEDIRYTEYKASIDKSTKKINSVSSLDVNYDNYGKVIKDYYTACVNKLNDSSYSKLASNDIVDGKVIYDLNYEVLNELNNVCLISMSSFIKESTETVKFDHNPMSTINLVKEKRNLILRNSDYLIDSGLGNSAYGFSTDIFKGTVYNKTISEFDLTVDNYTMIASVLEDIADWYVLEFGGNN